MTTNEDKDKDYYKDAYRHLEAKLKETENLLRYVIEKNLRLEYENDVLKRMCFQNDN